MSILKYIYRLQRIHNLIRMKATGPPDKFAEKLGVSRSTLMDNLNNLKEINAPIKYCKTLRSYYYEGEFNFTIEYSDKKKANK